MLSNKNKQQIYCKGKGKIHLRTGHEAPEREQSYSSTLHRRYVGWVVNATIRPLYSRERDPVPAVREAGWAPGRVWASVEKLAPTGIGSSDLPARSELLYRLSCAKQLYGF